jgi:hypothetical protein
MFFCGRLKDAFREKDDRYITAPDSGRGVSEEYEDENQCLIL